MRTWPENPFRDIAVAARAGADRHLEAVLGEDRWLDVLLAQRELRDWTTEIFSYAIPDDAALARIAETEPLVEVGAGTGYWARLLRDVGVDIIATDIRSPDVAWTRIEELDGPAAVAAHTGRTLLLVWPDLDPSTMASDTLDEFPGDLLVYVGEFDGCTGDRAFHRTLLDEWELVEDIWIPTWDGIRDSTMIWRRQ